MVKKIVIISSFALLMFFGGVAAAATLYGNYFGNPIVKVYVDGKELTGDAPSFKLDQTGLPYVPMKAVTEALGGKFVWDDANQSAYLYTPQLLANYQSGATYPTTYPTNSTYPTYPPYPNNTQYPAYPSYPGYTPPSYTPQTPVYPVYQQTASVLKLYSNDGRVYLGKLTSNTKDSESIYYGSGVYGSTTSATSIFNDGTIYGSKYSSESVFNPNASYPPIVVRDGAIVGHLTTNTSISDGISPSSLKTILYINNQ